MGFLRRFLSRGAAGTPANEVPPVTLREAMAALFSSAAMEYTAEYRTTNGEFIHTIAFGKMMAYRQLAVVLGDAGLTEEFDSQTGQILGNRRQK